MRLKSIRVQNFRCLENCELTLRDFTSLIGPNNSGKSAFLRAIEIFLNQTKPEPEEWRRDHEEEDIIIEGCFEEIQDWERDTPGVAGLVRNNEIRLRLVATRTPSPKGDIVVSKHYEAWVRQEAINGWSDTWGGLDSQIKAIAQAPGLEINGQSWKSAANKERVRQAIRVTRPDLVTYGEEFWTQESISIEPALKQAIPQAVLIQAVQDASDQAKPASKTAFGLLLNRVLLPALLATDEYGELQKAVGKLDARIRGKFLFGIGLDFASGLDTCTASAQLITEFRGYGEHLSVQVQVVAEDPGSKWKIVDANRGYLIRREQQALNVYAEKLASVRDLEQALYERMASVLEARAIIGFDLPDTDKVLSGGTSLKIDDGVETPIHLQGHGVQRALIFAMLEVLAKQDAIVGGAPESPRQRATVLLFEEPELYIHPHMMRRLKKALQEISESPNWQVIVSTHSPFLVDVASDPLSLIILRRPPRGCPEIRQLANDPFGADEPSERDREALRAALDFHPSVTEAFFARRVVLVEGDTEVAVLRYSDELLTLAGVDEEKADNTTIVSCGGKWTIPGMARLLSAFDIPFRIIHDQDRQGKSNEELGNLPPIHPYRANARIREVAGEEQVLIIDDTFEHVLDMAEIPHSAKPYHAWTRVRELCQNVSNLDHVPRLKRVVECAFNW
jgi:energy-coupling factor transporter ATP-binding protein EcfA2